MRRGFVIFASLSFIVSGLFQREQPAQAQTSDESQIRIAVDKFFAAVQKKDLGAITSLWCQEPAGREASTKTFQDMFAKIGTIGMPSALQVRKIDVNGVSASVRIYAELTATDAAGKPVDGFGKINRLFELTKENGAWRICRYVSAEEDLAARIASAKTDQDRNALLDANKDLMTVELERDLVAAANRMPPETPYEQVLAVLQLAERMADDLKDQLGAGTALRGTGYLQNQHGMSEQALETLKRSIVIYEGVGDKRGVAASTNALGIAYEHLSDYSRALQNYNRALDLVRELGDRRLVGRALNNIGLVESDLSDYASAASYYKESLAIEQELGDNETIAVTLQNIGNMQSSLGNYREALALHRRSLKMAGDLGLQALSINSLESIARDEHYQGNHARAIEDYRRCLELAKKTDDKVGMANALDSLGDIENEDGNYSEAEAHLRQGLSVAEATGNKQLVAVALNNLGTAMRETERPKEAQELFQRALRLEQDMSDRADVAATLDEIAVSDEAAGDHSAAIEAGEQSVRESERIGLPEYVVDASVALAKCYRAVGKTEEARQSLAKGISTVEGLRSQVAGGEFGAERYFEWRAAPYYAMADLLLDRDPVVSLGFAERSKARTLVDVLQSGRVDVTGSMTAEEKAREREINGKLASTNAMMLREKLLEHSDQARMAEIETDLRKARLDQESFEAELYAAHPDLRIHRGDFQPISLGQCSELIRDTHTALVEFLVSDSRSDVFVVTKLHAGDSTPKLATYKVDVKKDDLTKLVEQFHERLIRRDLSAGELSRKLYDLLLRPLEPELNDKSNLVIVPDLALWELPFQALQSSANHFLVEDHSIAYAPSLSALRQMQMLKHGSGSDQTRFVGFANPLLRSERSAEIKDAFMDADLQPLPQAEIQVRQIADLFGLAHSRIYIGPEATEDRLKSWSGGYHELYIAAHGIVNNASPMYSQIILSQAQGSEEDGILEAWEVVNMNISADLVVLSACDTAGGKIGPGEGMIGLSWAFFIAGCPSTVVSQWNVDADATTQLMVDFHRGMIAGKSKAEALRQAELGLLRGPKYSQPFYWAPFVVVGDAR